MLKKYPHTVTIVISKEVDAANSPLTGIAETKIENLKGRYESKGGGRNMDYSAAFFCDRLEILETDHKALDGQKLFFNGSWIGIGRAFNYQTHCEIWLD